MRSMVSVTGSRHPLGRAPRLPVQRQNAVVPAVERPAEPSSTVFGSPDHVMRSSAPKPIRVGEAAIVGIAVSHVLP